ncbi:MAG TPA: choice-of-anchor tandem repeat GloVer-containing protein [Rhizomicrobium sp.]|nr:choice-of-anchor tandem repeat GloVer-containing protein [Rhizomicrobium sp.]
MRALALSAALMAAAGSAQWSAASAYTMKTLFTFCDQFHNCNGNSPAGGLVMDGAGNLYGTTFFGSGGSGQGTIFELIPNAKKTSWRYKLLFACKNENCTALNDPVGSLIIDTAGNLYGVTIHGGTKGSGNAFELSPNADRTRWTIKNIYNFCAGDGCTGSIGLAYGLTYVGAPTGALYDGVSPLYGSTTIGGAYNGGTVFQLTSVSGAKTWHQKILYSFQPGGLAGDGGANPVTSLLVDAQENIYGTNNTSSTAGTVFELTPNSKKTKWTQVLLYPFGCDLHGSCPDGGFPQAGVIMDASGNLFGTTSVGYAGANCNPGASTCGTVFKLVPGVSPQYSVLHSFCTEVDCADGDVPSQDLIMDGSGNLFGVTHSGGANDGGAIFEISGATEQVIYSFCAQTSCADGQHPNNVIRDSSGNLYGMTTDGGSPFGGGVVFELVP